MRRFAIRFLLQPLGWLALAYLGFWLAWSLVQVLPSLAVSWTVGGHVSDWVFSSFFVSVSFVHGSGHANAGLWLRSISLFLKVTFLIGLVVVAARLKSSGLRTLLHFTGLWIVLLLALEAWQWIIAGRGDIGALIRLLGRTAPAATWARWFLGAPLILFLLFAGTVLTSRLIAEFRASWLPRDGKGWLAAIALAAPVELIAWGIFGFEWKWLAKSDLTFLISPAVIILMLAAIALLRKCSTPLGDGMSAKAAVSAVAIAAVLFTSAAAAPHLKVWFEERGLQKFSSAHYEIHYRAADFSSAAVQAFAAEHERVLAGEAARLQAPTDSLRVKIVLYGDFPSERRATRSHFPYTVEGTTIRAALTGYIHKLDPAADAAALLDAIWGKPGAPLAGEWVARWLAGEWRGRSVEAWAAQMEGEVGHLTVRELFEGAQDGEISPYVCTPLGAAWIGWAYANGGLSAVQKIYAGAIDAKGLAGASAELGFNSDQLEARWRDWTANLEAKYPPPTVPTRRLPNNFFFRGISFEDALSLEGGYSSPLAAEQIRALHEMGANAIAVVPYGFVNDATGGLVTYIRTGETDEGVSEAAYVAHQFGMKVMLKPQLWVRWGQFTGQIHFENEAARQRWMRSYREYILHYARVAELEQIDLLSVGNELEGVSGDEAEWRALIADVRRVYHGPLTYAANWGREFFDLRFWDTLDYAGLNNYYALASKPSANPNDLRAGAEALAAKLAAFHEQWHKLMIFTEVGYPSVHGAAVEPWVEDAGRTANLDEQAACYEAVFRGFAERPWVAGMFWWKWRSDGGGGGPGDGSYSPIGKPAAEVIRTWYTRQAKSLAKQP